MAAFPVNGVTSGASIDTSISTQTGAPQPQTQTAATEKMQQDTATLSPTAQALQLYQAGDTVTAVAAVLDVNIATVDGYLNISVQDIQTTQMPSPTGGASSVKI